MTGLRPDGGKDFFNHRKIFRVLLALINDERLAGELVQADGFRPGKGVLGGYGQAGGIADQLGEFEAAHHFGADADRHRHLQFAAAQLFQHFARGQIVQGDAHPGKLLLKRAQGGRRDPDRQRRGIARVNFPLDAAGAARACLTASSAC